MSQTSFIVDEATDKVLEELKKVFGVSTKAQVFRMSLALARVAARNADEDNTVTIKGKDGEDKIILLQG